MKFPLTFLFVVCISVAFAQFNPNLSLNNPNQNEFITFQQTEFVNAPVNPEMVKLAPIGTNNTNLMPMQMVYSTNFNCPVTPPAMNSYFVGEILNKSLRLNNLLMESNYVFDIQGNLISAETWFSLKKDN